jgi:hypothetical protein
LALYRVLVPLSSWRGVGGEVNLLLALLLLLLLVSCRRGAVEPLPTDAPTPTTLIGGQATFAPIITATHAAPEPTPARRCAPNPNTATAQYKVETTVDVDARSVTATMQVTYRNDTGQPIQQIVFNVEPNRKPGLFTLTSVEADNLDKFSLTGPRLEVNLKAPLDVDCTLTISLGFTVHLAAIQSGYLGRGYFGFSDRQLNLGEWLPEIAPFTHSNPGSWLTPQSWAVGEYTVSRMGDYDVSVKVHSTVGNMDVVGPGEAERVSADIWRFQASDLRTFTLCVSAGFSKLTATSDDGVTIDLYYFAKLQPNKAPDGTPISGPQHALETARQAVNRFTKLFGPLPYKRLVVVEGDFADGMEFSGMVFVSHDWFLRYEGKPDTWLTVITAHEISHQWWYSLVGSDQGEAPYLDEAFALYSELLYLEDKYPALVPWWWQFRVKMYQPQGFVDARTFDFTNLRLYINAVYLRGALMLQEIRERIGDEAFYKWLRAYATAQSSRIATPADLWQAMSPADYGKTADIRLKYLRQPDPLNPTPSATRAATATPTISATDLAPRPATDPCCG